MITIKTRFGTQVIEVSADSVKAVIQESAFFQSLPEKCPECGAPLKFTHRTPQDYEYFGMECTGPDKHAVNFGQSKDMKTLYVDYSKPWQSWQDRKAAKEQG